MIDIFNNFLIYKPYGVVSQFTKHANYKSLDSLYPFPKNVYPLGRLDAESEGLLILTDNPQLNQKLLHPKHGHSRTYWVEVEGQITQQAIQQMENGLTITVKGEKYDTQPAKCEVIDKPNLPKRENETQRPVTSWIALTLTEGKYHQVRKMTAGAGFPTLRLVRSQIANITLADLEYSVTPIDSKTLHEKLGLV